jgi:flagellar motor switch protein FliN
MSSDATADPATEPSVDAGPLGLLPHVNGRQVQWEGRVARLEPNLRPLVSWLSEPTGFELEFGHPEIAWRPAGLARPGVIAQFVWPRMSTRVGLGIETAVAHALVDRLLGFERFAGEDRLQVTPVEWGILTYTLAEMLTRLAERDGPVGPWDLTIDRVGPDAFDSHDLGGVTTIRWPLKVGATVGSVRLWLSEPLVARFLSEPPGRAPAPAEYVAKTRELASGYWRAEAGTIPMPRGLSRLRAGGVLPLVGGTLHGTVKSPSGPVRLVLRGRDTAYCFDAEPAPNSGGGRVVIQSELRYEPVPREPIAVTPSTDPTASAPAAGPTEIPVTLTIELGRVSIPLSRLADLKSGDVLELGRHAREPVELTSGGRLVARGELIQIDTELGVRVTNVLL